MFPGSKRNALRHLSDTLTLFDFLESDSNFVAVHENVSTGSAWHHNKSLRNSELRHAFAPFARNSVEPSRTKAEIDKFQHWLAECLQHTGPEACVPFEYGGIVWSYRALSPWSIVSGTQLPNRHDAHTSQKEIVAGNGRILDNSTAPPWPIIRAFLTEPLSDHQAFVRDFDWSSTPLGPMSQWDSQLIETVSLALINSEPAAVFWGKEMTSIYNEAFVSIAGQKHPGMMGGTPMAAFAEIWDVYFAAGIEESHRTKKPFHGVDLSFLLERLGFPEEVYMTFTFLPLLGYSGEVVGFYHTVSESTRQLVNERRLKSLLELSGNVSRAEDRQSFWELLVDSLSQCQVDIPFAMVYSLSEVTQDDMESISPTMSVSRVFNPMGGHGFPSEHQLRSPILWEEDETSDLTLLFKRALEARNATTYHGSDLPSFFLSGIDCNTVTLCPLRPTNNHTEQGLVVLGLTNQRPHDSDQQQFIELFSQGMSNLAASATLLEDEKRRGKTAAEQASYEQAELAARIQDQEHRFRLVADNAPVGLFECTTDGDILFCNQTWCDLMGTYGTDISFESCLQGIHEDDRALIVEYLGVLGKGGQDVHFEIRLAMEWETPESTKDDPIFDDAWVVCTAYPVFGKDGSVKSIMGSLTDISLQKYALRKQNERMNDVMEAKRQQENFVDMTSHEMRNPLNAMLLCAHELNDTLTKLAQDPSFIGVDQNQALPECLGAVETILYCGTHQKRIIDDILVLSKMDAKLLQIQPIEVRPLVLVEETLKLFESDVRAQGIKMEYQLMDSFHRLDVRAVLLDPSRVVQILVNFIANAIKFTKTEDIRRVTIVVGASTTRPSADTLRSRGIRLVSDAIERHDPTSSEGWGIGEKLYLEFEVRDTGPGISSNDIDKLFNRFSQNQPKTHAHYGGSGLGLFISQQLAELQGGMVGIASKPSEGSTFYFYIKCKRSTSSIASIPSGPPPMTRALSSKDPRNLTQSSKRASANVLLVEDNIINQTVLKKQLEKRGHSVSVANHGREALDMVELLPFFNRNTSDSTGPAQGPSIIQKEVLVPDLILMDIEMPIMDGRECVRHIRKLEHDNSDAVHIPVIALTANARPEQIAGAKAGGFDDVLSKPYMISDVLAQIEKFVGQQSER